MKHYLLKTCLTMLCLILGIGSAWADSYTITFGNNVNAATALSNTTKASTVIAEGTEYVTSQPFTLATSTSEYYGDSKTCIRLGSTGNAGGLTIALSEKGQVNATSVVVNCYCTGKKNTGATITCNSSAAGNVPADNYDDVELTLTGSKISSLVLSTSKSVFIHSITVYYSTDDSRTESNLSFGAIKTFDVNVGHSFDAPTLSAADNSILSEVTYTSSNIDVATVNSTTGEVTLVGNEGSTTITATFSGNEDYYESNDSYVINVIDPNKITAIFDLSSNKYSWSSTNEGSVYFDGSTFTPAVEHGVTLSVSGNVRMWGTSESSLRLYGASVGTDPNTYEYGLGSITLTAPVGYEITSIKLSGSSLTFNASEGEYASSTWTGKANSVTLSKGSNTPQIKTITVVCLPAVAPAKGSFRIGTRGFGTYCTDHAYVMPEGVQGGVYTMNGGDVELSWSYQAGATVPANEAVLLKGAAGEHEYTIDNDNASAPVQDNLLKGCVEETAAWELTEYGWEDSANDEYYFYKLSASADGTGYGWYWGAAEGASFTCAANKCVLVLEKSVASSPQRALILIGDETLTSIDAIEATSNNAAIFDLQGRRVRNTQNGVYVVNGKKVIR